MMPRRAKDTWLTRRHAADLEHARRMEAIAAADPTPLNLRYYVAACRCAGIRPVDNLTPSWYRPDGFDSDGGT